MSTADATVALPDEIDLWRHRLADAFAGLRTEAVRTDWMQGTLPEGNLGEVSTFKVTGYPHVLRRTPRVVREQPVELLKVCLPLRGRMIVHQFEHELVVEPGGLAVYDTGRPYDLRLDGDWECAVMTFPRSALGLPEAWVTGAMGRIHEARQGPGSVLRNLIPSSLQQAGIDIPASARIRFGEAGVQLLASVISQEKTVCTDEASDAMRLQAIEYVRYHCQSPNLSHGDVASALHMSPRTLDRLFENEPSTLTEMIREMRLDGARRELIDPRSTYQTVSAVAAHWCFPDAAHFSRLFKSRFGVSPSMARQGTHTW